MGYVEGFVVAVPEANKAAYRAHAAAAVAMFRDHGATRMVECWGDDVPHGTVTDFWQAVRAEPGEAVLFSWIEYPSRAVRDAANVAIMTDPRMAALMAPPFDARRIVMGGFEVILDA